MVLKNDTGNSIKKEESVSDQGEWSETASAATPMDVDDNAEAPNENGDHPPGVILVNADFVSSITTTLELLNKRIEQLQLELKKKKTPAGPRSPNVFSEDIFVGDSADRKTRRAKRSPENNIIRQVIRTQTQVLLQIDVEGSVHEWKVADSARADGYNKKMLRAQGPDLDNFVMDWQFNGLTQWLRDCMVIFLHLFRIELDKGSFPQILVDVSDFTIKSSFRDYVLYLKRRYIKQTTVPARAVVEKTIANKRARSLNRRQQLLGRRLALMKHHGLPEQSVTMVETLDIDTMSSEESEGEVGMERKFRVKKLPWRNLELASWLHRIDNLPTKNAANLVLIRRRGHRARERSDIVSLQRPALTGMPVNFYQAEWLRSQDARALRRLKVVETPFDLPKIDDFLPKA